jgi:pimeloyl-ACP methyl ester carboxylesterase
MEKVDILEAPDLDRRRFLSAAAMALAAAELGVIRSARAQAGAENQPAASAGVGPLKQIAAKRQGMASRRVDTIALMDALEIQKAILGGFDWGARTADIVAALWPERCNGLVSVSGYLIGSQEAGKKPLPPSAELQWWYQYYFATERGRAGYEQ